MDPNALPRAIAMQYDKGEIVYMAGGQPMLHEYSYNGRGVRILGKTTDFLHEERFQRAHARGWTNGCKKRSHIDDDRWVVHVALWAATQAARLAAALQTGARHRPCDAGGVSARSPGGLSVDR